MSENASKPASSDEPLGGSEIGNFPDRQMEAQPGVFEGGQKRINGPVEELSDVPSERLDHFGDSRPDETQKEDAELVDIAREPNMTTTRDPGAMPKVRHEDPQRLEESRVGQNDDLIAKPSGLLNEKEISVIQPKSDNHEDK
jgi:hypothetical protein